MYFYQPSVNAIAAHNSEDSSVTMASSNSFIDIDRCQSCYDGRNM